MNPGECLRLLAGLCVAAACLQAQDDDVPAILVPKTPAAGTAGATEPSTFLSALTRQHLTDAMFARVPITVPPVDKHSPAPGGDGDAIRMDPYIVIPSGPPDLAMPRAANPFVRFLKTGTLFRSTGPRFDTALRFHIWIIQTPPDPRINKEFSRYELRFSLRF